MAGKTKNIKGMSPFSDDRYMVEDDLRTLTRAEEIKRDPKRMKKVRALAKEKLAEMKAVAGGDAK
jgi:hypothetical protein